MALVILALMVTSFALMQQSDAVGVFYTRWGRSICPYHAVLVYSGYAAGSHYTHKGGGSNYLCLPTRPQWGSTVPGIQAHSGLIYGVEYELALGYTDGKPFSYINNWDHDLHDNDAPCAVCFNKEATTQLMIPGLQRCPSPNMQLEYQGYLVSEFHGHHRTEFVCLDKAPAVIMGGKDNRNGALFYPVQAMCGSLPCPPYVEGNELTCVVCTS